MAEHKLEGAVIGLSFDGTGYGTDGAIWGSEILIAEEHDFKRAGHLAYVSMPGSAAAIKEPWRMAVAYLWTTFGEEFFQNDRSLPRRWDRERIAVLSQMMARQVNSPLTSSCGRLFDAVAAMVGLRDLIAYEGQAAIELEQCMEPTAKIYHYEFKEVGGRLLLSPTVIFAQVYEDATSKMETGLISGKFHQTLVAMFVEACQRQSRLHGLDRVVCSGGVFQNVSLLGNLEGQLRASGLEVYTPQRIPANDACISLGQAVIGAASLEE